jgi:CRISPR-associated endonuclease/helicase Cas3
MDIGLTEAVQPLDKSLKRIAPWVETVALPAGPSLYIIEDSTGSGKTEAALMLAHRLISDGRADGLYVALPTQATANGLYRRLALPPNAGAAPVYANLFATGTRPSLILSHAARDLHPVFRASIFDPNEPALEGAGAQCAAWIGDNRRAGFSAQVGVGTIDQALMSVLPVTHQALRLGALAQRVLVLDVLEFSRHMPKSTGAAEGSAMSSHCSRADRVRRARP